MSLQRFNIQRFDYSMSLQRFNNQSALNEETFNGDIFFLPFFIQDEVRNCFCIVLNVKVQGMLCLLHSSEINTLVPSIVRTRFLYFLWLMTSFTMAPYQSLAVRKIKAGGGKITIPLVLSATFQNVMNHRLGNMLFQGFQNGCIREKVSFFKP